MSAASAPPGEQYLNSCKSDYTHLFVGSMDGNDCSFYFNTKSQMFCCLAKVEGSDVCMVGDIDGSDDKIECKPRYGKMPGNEEWADTSGEEVKKFDITKTEIDFEGAILKRA